MSAKEQMTLTEWGRSGGVLFIGTCYTILRHWMPTSKRSCYLIVAQTTTSPFLATLERNVFNSLDDLVAHCRRSVLMVDYSDVGTGLYT